MTCVSKGQEAPSAVFTALRTGWRMSYWKISLKLSRGRANATMEKTGKPLVFPQFRLERRQEITRVDQRIVFRFAPRFEQTELDVYRIKKMFERLKIRNFDDIRKRVGVRPRKIAEGERFFP